MMVFRYAFDLNSNTYSVTDALDGDSGDWALPGTYGTLLGGGTPGTHVVQTNSGDSRGAQVRRRQQRRQRGHHVHQQRLWGRR
jgi:hypothetical protein